MEVKEEGLSGTCRLLIDKPWSGGSCFVEPWHENIAYDRCSLISWCPAASQLLDGAPDILAYSKETAKGGVFLVEVPWLWERQQALSVDERGFALLTGGQ